MELRPAAESRRWLWFTLVLAASMLCGWQMQSARQSATSWPANVATTVLQPAQSAATGLDQGVRGLFGGLRQHRQLVQENAALRARLAEYRPTVERLVEADQELARLRALLRLQETEGLSAVAARTVARGPSPWFQTLTVNCGGRWGVAPGAAVLAPGGLVGQVFQVSAVPTGWRIALRARSM